MGLESFSNDDSSDTTTDDPLDGLGEDELRDRLKTLREIVVSQDAELERVSDKVDNLEERVDSLITMVEYLQETSGNENDTQEGKGSGSDETDNDDSKPLFG